MAQRTRLASLAREQEAEINRLLDLLERARKRSFPIFPPQAPPRVHAHKSTRATLRPRHTNASRSAEDDAHGMAVSSTYGRSSPASPSSPAPSVHLGSTIAAFTDALAE